MRHLPSILVLASLTLATMACLSSDSRTNSETHFLKSCDSSCDDGLQCACGVCTVTCSESSDCDAQHADATCTSDINAACGGLAGLAMVCDVGCMDDDECASLGGRYECVDGQCRGPHVDDKTVVGSGGTIGGDGDGDVSGDGDGIGIGGAMGTGGSMGAGGSIAINPIPVCEYNGREYAVGASFDSTDGCNTCSCTGAGLVACTERACATQQDAGSPGNVDGGGANSTCDLAFEVGECDAIFEVWWYNNATGQCQTEIYGGCGGNDNRFDTQSACLVQCGAGD